MKASIFQRYFLPGFVFQSVVVGGGYATGRELAEFFLPAGPWGGLLGMVVAMVVWSLVMGVSFEFARLTKSYDYRTFFAHVLGPGWVLFEVAYLLLMVLVLSVLGAAAGVLIEENFGMPSLLGTASMMAAVGVLVFYGSEIIEKFLAGWSFLLYGTYAVFVLLCLSTFGDRIADGFASPEIGGGWFMGGISYAGYNLAVVPVAIFCTRHITTRREAVTAGLLGGPIGMIPALLFFVAMMGYYPDIGSERIPANYLLEVLDLPWFYLLFQVVIFGTFIETGTGMIHAVNERVAEVYEEKGRHMPKSMRPGIAIGMLAIAIFAASAVGIVDLIGQGYGMLTYAFLAIYVLPILTLGLWRVYRAG